MSRENAVFPQPGGQQVVRVGCLNRQIRALNAVTMSLIIGKYTVMIRSAFSMDSYFAESDGGVGLKVQYELRVNPTINK